MKINEYSYSALKLLTFSWICLRFSQLENLTQCKFSFPFPYNFKFFHRFTLFFSWFLCIDYNNIS